MKTKAKEAMELEAELLRLNALVRYRRAQLSRIDECPNPECECRRVWRDQVEQSLAHQVGQVRRKVKKPAKKRPAKKA